MFFVGLAYAVAQWLKAIVAAFAAAMGLGIVIGLCARRGKR